MTRLFLSLPQKKSLLALAFCGALAGSAGDGRAATLVVTNANDGWDGTFRQAITNANTMPGLDTIAFEIPGSGAHTLIVTSALPAITDPVVIDGTTQPGFAADYKPVIELDGSIAGANAGLRLLAGNTTVRGLAINRFGAQGVLVQGPGTNIIQGNFIGIGTNGTAARGNTSQGIWINGSWRNLIGGTNAAERNIISGNGDTGVYLLNGGVNLVQGNFIGTGAGGTNALPNTYHGVAIYSSQSNLVGGGGPGQRNVISGNGGSGVYLKAGAVGNLVQGNYIGTDRNGLTSITNLGDGVTVESASNNTIGGTDAGAGNLLSGNSLSGVSLYVGAVNNQVQGNLIGTDLSGRLGLGNKLSGVTLASASGNLVGGSVAAARNVISANQLAGVLVSTNSTSNVIAGNFIGVDLTGTNALGNRTNGISINSASANTVGGTTSSARNIVSGNTNYGIEIFNSGATTNLVQGNYIGTDFTGRFAVSNALCGLHVLSSGNTIGGLASAAGNLISGNGQDGICLEGTAAAGNSVQGNFIGTDATGTVGVPNLRAGIGISGAPANTIGGTTLGAGNLISANGDAGIYLIGAGAAANQVQGNKLGTDISGTYALGNTYEGLYLERAPSNTIGGPLSGAGNLISGNNTRGIWLTNASWNVISGNLIGTKRDGLSALGNVYHNIECEAGAGNNLIGGGLGAGNTLAFAQTVYCGVRIRNGSTNNAILGNSIFANGALGIDLGGAGTNTNDHCDADTGANMSQNSPVLTQAVSGTGTGVRGTLDSRANSTFLLQFFANPACDSSGTGEGQIYLGDKTIVTSPGCTTNFVATLPVSIPVGYVVTATTTDVANNTSEFSACVTVGPVPSLNYSGPTNRVNPKLTLAWTNSAAGFVLKQANTLTPPVQWTTVTNVPVVSNGQFVVTVAMTVSNRFYLLSFE